MTGAANFTSVFVGAPFLIGAFAAGLLINFFAGELTTGFVTFFATGLLTTTFLATIFPVGVLVTTFLIIFLALTA